MSTASLPFSDPLPGTEPYPAALLARLVATRTARGFDHRPRTRHLRDDGTALYTNRLFLETSPYLLQHAHNPVNWFPWGDEAFAEARRLGRPVLLSVGYSTCHWCHVMEEESFEDLGIAAYLNAHYIPVKVDREERPDVDAIYMAAVQALTGHGGWPMTVWLTADRQPYYGGTYFPPRDGSRGARTGFLTLLRELRRIHDEEPERAATAARELTEAVRVRLATEPAGDELPAAEVLHQAFRLYRNAFDEEWGGFAGAPKFPSSLPLRFLLRYHRRFRSEEALEMAELTLTRMAEGGLHDHVAGGFHRYTVDDRWLVPHFEKMLYDNALLVPAYLEGFQATGNRDFATIAAETLDYVAREMTSPEGAFYAATDADSANPEKGGEREEGWYFTWTPADVELLLGDRASRLVTAYFGVTPEGNFEDRRTVLHVARPLAEVAREQGLTEAEAQAILKQALLELRHARSLRPAPLRDDKILTAWNALMISAFARGSQVLHEPAHLERAVRAADFILQKLMTPEGRLRRGGQDGEGRLAGYLEDYAFTIAALLDLYEAGFDLRHLRAALRLEEVVQKHFEDPDQGGYYMTSDDHETLLVREKPHHDGATPSGNAVMALSLLRLAALTGEPAYAARAERTLRAFHGPLSRHPHALAEMLLAVDFLQEEPHQIVLVTANGKDQAEPFLARLHGLFLPNRVLAAASGRTRAEAARLVPLFKDREAGGQGVTAYVCQNQTCQLPVHDPDAFIQQLTRNL